VHPEVGGRNRRALGQRDAPLRTVDQVLDVMMEQTESSIRTEQRMLLSARLKRGQLFENSPRVKEALAIWDSTAHEAFEIVEECREQLRQEVAKGAGGDRGSFGTAESDSDSGSDASESQEEYV
jgi:E3 ubiquitin-protein ligase SHPRH